MPLPVNGPGISWRPSFLITTAICTLPSSPPFFFCFLFLAVCLCFSSCHERQERCRVDWLQAGYYLPSTENGTVKIIIIILTGGKKKNPATFFPLIPKRFGRQIHLEDGRTPAVCTERGVKKKQKKTHVQLCDGCSWNGSRVWGWMGGKVNLEK